MLSRLRGILTGQDDSPEYAHLTPEMKGEILEILSETLPEFAQPEPASEATAQSNPS